MAFPIVVTQETVDNFNRPSMEASKARAHANAGPRRRDSGTVKSEYTRVRNALASITGMRDKTREKLSNAKEQLEVAEKRLRELRAAGFTDRSSDVQKLIGYYFRSKVYDTSQHHPGLIEQLRGTIDTESKRLAELEVSVTKEQERIAPKLAELAAEYNEALSIENVAEGQTRPSRLMTREA